MGREATCKCQWSGTTANVKALLESTELILRGEIRKRIPFTEIQSLKVQSDCLTFTVHGEPVSLSLGEAAATRWATTIKSPPTLAHKLGITASTTVHVIGKVDDEALKTALAEAGKTSTRKGNLIIARVDTPEALHAALPKSSAALLEGAPLWVVYPKGPGHKINETLVRSTLLANNLVDTKVAAVSPRLTALRFNHRKT
jgi:hypothetical protein